MRAIRTVRHLPAYAPPAIETDTLGAGSARSRGVVDLLLTVGMLMLFGLSGYALESFGIPYYASGGSIITKIHPSTFIFSVTLALAIVANRQPVPYLASLVVRRWGSVYLIAASLFLWLFISRYKPDATAAFVFDALIAGGLIALLLADVSDTVRNRLAVLLHAVVAANCLIAVAEMATDWRLFPFVLGEREQVWDYRATALFGHPLVGALVTGVYAVILMTVRDVRGLAERWRIPMVALCLAAMPALGARTSFAIVYGTAGLMLLWGCIRFLAGGRVNPVRLVGVLLAVPAVVLVVGGLAYLGYFDGIVGRFVDDSGSAQTRLQLFALFDRFGPGEAFMGFGTTQLDTNVRMQGLAEGIENAWAAHLLRYGVVASAVLWLGIAAYFAELLRSAGRSALLPLVFVFLVLSTSVGISGKTTMLTMPAMLILVLLGGRNGGVALAPRPLREGQVAGTGVTPFGAAGSTR